MERRVLERLKNMAVAVGSGVAKCVKKIHNDLSVRIRGSYVKSISLILSISIPTTEKTSLCLLCGY
jgi:hypothetical protein